MSFVYTNKKRERIEVMPTLHSIEQFAKRYELATGKSLDRKDHTYIVSLMEQHFNRGERFSNEILQKRNGTRREGVSVIYIRWQCFTFVVNPIDNIILTTELKGKLGKLNIIHTKKEKHHEDHARIF